MIDPQSLLERAVRQLGESGHFAWACATRSHAEALSDVLTGRLPGSSLQVELPIPGGPFLIYDQGHAQTPGPAQRVGIATWSLKQAGA